MSCYIVFSKKACKVTLYLRNTQMFLLFCNIHIAKITVHKCTVTLFSSEIRRNLAPEGCFPLENTGGIGVLAQPLLRLTHHEKEFLILRIPGEFGLALLLAKPSQGCHAVGIEHPGLVVLLQVRQTEHQRQELADIIRPLDKRPAAEYLRTGIHNHAAKLQHARIAGTGCVHRQSG